MKNSILRMMVIVAGLTMSAFAHAATDWSAQDYDLYTGDFNGDGKTDILYVAKDPSKPSGIAASDGTGPNIPLQSWQSNYLGIPWSSNQYNVIVGDFNGDGCADIFLQRATPGDSYLLLTSCSGSPKGQVIAISQTVSSGALGLVWSADQHNIVAGDFNGDGKTDLFLQATSPAGVNAVVYASSTGQFTASPTQSWNDGYLGFKWATSEANVFVGNFDGSSNSACPKCADLLIQAKPTFITIAVDDISFPVPTYPPNMNGIVLSVGGATPFGLGATPQGTSTVQAWSRTSNGVDWSPLTNSIIVSDFNGDGRSDVLLQAKYSGQTSYVLTAGNGTSLVFPTTTNATAITSNVALTSDSARLITGNFAGAASAGLYIQALSASGTNYLTSSVGATITATAQTASAQGSGINASTAPGRTAGQFSVTPTGNATYNIPIWTPPGVRQIEPHLALHYTSGGPDGMMGPGWSLAGASMISRCGKTWNSSNGSPASVFLSTTDDLCLDSNRLILTSGQQGMAGSTYEPEIADFSKITAYGSQGQGPQYFVIKGKDGRFYEYGNPANGSNAQIFGVNAATPYAWTLDKVSDRQGNTMTFTYTGSSIATLSKIQYTATANNAAGYEVDFNYIARVGGTTISKYVGGNQVTQSNQLDHVTVLANGVTVRLYKLTYQSSPSTHRPLLTSSQECGGSSGTDCLRPTTFSYQSDGTLNVQAQSPSGIPVGSKYGYALLDFNGDGVLDEVSASVAPGSNTVNYFVNLGNFGPALNVTNYFAPTNVVSPILTGALKGDGTQQFLIQQNGYWWVYWNGATSSSTSGTTVTFAVGGSNTGIPVDTSAGVPILVDWDGDGLADMLVQSNNGTIYVIRNISKGGVHNPVAFDLNHFIIYTPTTIPASVSLGTGGPSNSQISSVSDFNGDGRADLIIDYYACPSNPTPAGCNNRTYALLSNGFSGPANISVISNSVQLKGTTGDWNGDGCTDFLTSDTIYISTCNGGFVAQSTAAPNPGSVVAAIDFDGDGQSDLLYQNTLTNTIWLITSNGGVGTPSATNLNIAITYATSCFAADLVGRGSQEILCTDSTTGNVTTYTNLPLNNAAVPARNPQDLMSSISDGFGITFSPKYISIADILSGAYARPAVSTAAWPNEDFQGAYFVVSQFSASDGSGGTYTNNFSYGGAQYNTQGRGFVGFAQTTQTDSRNNVIDKKSFQQGFPYIGNMTEEDVLEPDNTTYMSRNVISIGSTTLGSVGGIACARCYFPYAASSTAYTYEPTGSKKGGINSYIATTVTQYTYDSYGTQTDTKTTVTDTDAAAPASPFVNQQWITEIKNPTIVNDTVNWCLGRPTLSTTTKTVPGQAPLTRTVTHVMDPDPTQCRAQQEIVEPNTPLQVTSTFTFDPKACGNTTGVSVVGLDQNGNAMPARATTTQYGANCEMPEYVTNALKQTTQTVYRYDLVLPIGQIDPNGVQIGWQYDDFGRKTLESRPDGTSTAYTYSDCVAISCWGTSDLRFLTMGYLYDASGALERTTAQYADGLDRVRFTEGNRAQGVWTTTQTTYDKLGRKATVSLPYGLNGNGYHQYSYDVASRVTQDATYTNTGAFYRGIQMGYAGMTVSVTDPNGNTITKVSDVAGKIRQVTDPNTNGTVAGTTKYTFDPFGNLITLVDATGATSTYTYNIRGFKTGSQDADTGSWTFKPDSLNELMSQTDANKQTTTFGYDAIGRMTARTEPESTAATTWTYDVDSVNSSAKVIGRLVNVSKPDGYAEYYQYDSIERPLTVTYTEDGTSYPFNYAYNKLGAVDTLQYPVSTSGYQFTLKNVYDSFGFLNQTVDANAGTVFWALNATNDSSMPTLETLGNSVQIATGYTPWTNEVTSRAEGSFGSTNNLQNLSYNWDLVGNLYQRIDNRQSLTEQFTYDSMNRLMNSTLNTATNLSMQYDASGNIVQKSDVSAAAYVYGDPAHKHAVTQAGSWSMTYDANGNMLNRASGAISWYSYNLPNTINYSGNSTQFFYNANHQRWKQIANYAGTTETTHYVGGMLEVMSRGTQPAEYRHLIPGGSAMISYTRRTDGTTSTYYATSDHLGSSDLVMDSSANVLTRESFTPFGARRGSNWSGIPSASDYAAFGNTTRRGFTGHEMLDSVSLIHMNGRVYDPYLGRFISADTVIQNLGATQSVNPYAYAWNNPLKYVDPSGHSLLGEILGIIVAIVVIIATDGYAAFLAGDISFGAAVAAGFAGGFVSTLVSTGSFSAALMSGLIGAVTAAAFYGVGTLAKMDNWGSLQVELAHAAVGCASAAASGGNCGRGAAAAFLSEAANQSGYMEKPGDLASWGSAVGTAEAGLVGGVSSEISGGSFSDGFSVGAAGYLFNSLGHSLKRVPFTDDQGQQILNINRQPMMKPDDINPDGVTWIGKMLGSDSGLIALQNFRQGGPWDFQRVGSDRIFVSDFTDFANVSIGLYAAAAGIPESATLNITNDYAWKNSSYGPQIKMDATWTHLPVYAPYDIHLGYQLYQSGRIGTGQN